MTEAETKDAIIAAINDLPEEQKKLLLLHYYEGLSLDEIAEIMYPEDKEEKEG